MGDPPLHLDHALLAVTPGLWSVATRGRWGAELTSAQVPPTALAVEATPPFTWLDEDLDRWWQI